MINSLDDIDLQSNSKLEDIDQKLQQHLNISLLQLQNSLQDYLSNNQKIAEDFNLIAPYGDYSKCHETPESISHFLKHEASQSKNWELQAISEHDTNSSLLQFTFANSAIDEGDSCTGIVLVSKAGKIKHTFAQV